MGRVGRGSLWAEANGGELREVEEIKEIKEVQEIKRPPTILEAFSILRAWLNNYARLMWNDRKGWDLKSGS